MIDNRTTPWAALILRQACCFWIIGLALIGDGKYALKPTFGHKYAR